jgi:hypothetical protein
MPSPYTLSPVLPKTLIFLFDQTSKMLKPHSQRWLNSARRSPAWERRVKEVIDEDTGLTAFVISAADLMTNKLAAARSQDIADAAAVRRAVELRSTNEEVGNKGGEA